MNDDAVSYAGCIRRVADEDGNILEAKLGEDNSLSSISGKIVGNPETMPRPRGTIKWSRAKPRNIQYYNPKQATVNALNNKLKSLVERAGLSSSVYSKDSPLAMVVYFHMKRPLTDFKSSKREKGLKPNASPSWAAMRKDVDNLAKFFLDAGNKALYEDDKSIVVLSSARVLHSEGTCEGCTYFRIKPLRQGDVEPFDEMII